MAKAKIKRLYLIPILSKALDVIELFEQESASLTLEDVYQRTNISKTSVYRILKTLVHRGYLAQTPNGQYRLVSRPRRLRFGFAVQSAEMPYSEAVAQSVSAAAAASGVELLMLDNRYDPAVAVSNAEEFVAKRVDLVLEFQVEEAAAPRVAHIFKKADIPLVAIDVPHPNATYFGVDNFEVGYEAASILAQYAQRKWKGKVDRVVGLGFSEAGSFVQNRITGAFDGIRERFKDLTPEQFVQIEGRGMREASQQGDEGIPARMPARRAHAGGRGNRLERPGRAGRGARGWAGRELRHRGAGLHSRSAGGDAARHERHHRVNFARAGNVRPAADPAGHCDFARIHGAALQLRAPQGGDAGDAGRRGEGAHREASRCGAGGGGAGSWESPVESGRLGWGWGACDPGSQNRDPGRPLSR